MSVGHALMGVLCDGPAHGYDIKRAHDDRYPGAKPLAYGQVYSALSRLERDGFVEVVATDQAGGPERTTYSLTDAGDRALREWLEQVEPAGPYAADDLVRKVVTALRLGSDAAGFLARQRQAHLSRMRELLVVQREAATVDSRIAIDHTIFHLDADLKWLETAAARVAAEGAEPS